jgi:phosphoribosyl 1,2-cyclic phosphate phosphodiesterase
MNSFSVTILGSGTSAGVPMIGCHCPVCSSTDPRDNRTRPSIVVHYLDSAGKLRHILIDTTPELRIQAVANRLDWIDAVVYTHAHADHIFGLDDVRRYNTLINAPLPLYAAPHTMEQLKTAFAYAFSQEHDPRIFRPALEPHLIEGPFSLFDQTWTPIPLIHGRHRVLGFRIGTFAYCTDCSLISEESLAQLHGLDLLIIDALRPRPHPTHLSFDQALAYIAQLAPKQALFTHLSHDISHADAERDLPAHVRVAYDGMGMKL